MLDEKCVFNAARRFGPTEARRHYLARACDGHPHLLARVEALLRIHDEEGDFLKPPVLDERTDFSLSGADGSGETIGPYTLLGRLGEGGMGVVYLAEQSHPVRRQVALKVVRPGADTAKVIARFEDEREALALMDHPHIARVLDAGVTPSGRPYFVMELVRGVPVTRYCDERRLTIRERLALFAQVCRGVQHAHQKGVIHRDIKPSNVLVTEVDGNPVPKIIDFGLAKWTRREATDSTLLTLVGAVVGTPEYMSPEQADVTRLDIDTRADVYSLGVLLFELLTGTTPLDWGDSARPQVLELLARIREEESPRPSARLGSRPTLSEVAAARGVEPAKLVGLVRGDLDWIVLKCLEKDRNRRYETADALATDVERHLRHEPVAASPPSRSYRLRKFARRHRVPLATAAGFVLLLLAGVAVSTGLAMRAMDAERKAVAERDRTEAARGQARKALDTLTDEAVERLMARQPQLTEADRAFLRHVLALHEEFAREDGDRAAVADARYRVGLIRHKLGEHREAEEAFRAAAAHQQELADEFPNQPDRRRDLARTHRRLAVLLRETGRPADAERHAATAAEVTKKLVDEFPDRPDYRRESAAARTTHGNILMATNKLAEAEECHRAAVEMLQPLTSPDDRRQLAGCHQNLGAVYHHTNKPDRAEECYLTSRKLFQQLADESHGLPDDRRDLAQLLGNLAALYVETQRRPQAEEVFRTAVAVHQQLTDEYPTRPDYRRLLASSHSNLANLLTRMKKFPQVEREYLAAKAGYERLAGDFPLAPEYQADLGRVLAGLALLKSIGKDHDAAAKLLKQALVHDRAALRVEPANPVYREACRTHLAVLAEVYGSNGDHAAAADTADELARFAFDPPEDHFTAAWITVRCVGLANKDKTAADAYADRAMAHLRAAVRHGFKDVTRLKAKDFDPLRSRDDFRQLLRDLGGRP